MPVTLEEFSTAVHDFREAEPQLAALFLAAVVEVSTGEWPRELLELAMELHDLPGDQQCWIAEWAVKVAG